MTLSVITINAINYDTYASRAQVNNYLNVEPVRMADWNALADSDAARGIYIIAATRRLNLLSWQGTKTGGASQVNAFPRTGLLYADGTAVSTSEVPQEIEDATALLAGSINLDTDTADNGSSGSNVKTAVAGSVNVSFFRQTDGLMLQDETAFKLISQWMEAATTSTAIGAMSTADPDAASRFSDIDNWGRTGGYP